MFCILPSNKKRGNGVGVYYNHEACRQCTDKCTKDARGQFHYLLPMEKSSFSKTYNDKDLLVKQIRIKPDKAKEM
jgi:hypothetical protein